MKRMIASVIVFFLLIFIALPVVGEQELTEEQRNTLLSLLLIEDEQSNSFVVLPEDFMMPAIGLDGEYRLLILGIDTDREDLKGRSDTMILAVLNTGQKTLHLISFMRDLYVKIPGKGHNRLNAAYSFGGPALLKKTLEENFGIVSDAYLAVNFVLMSDLIDSIGGVEIQVEEYELKPLNGIMEYYNYQRGVEEDFGKLAVSGTRTLTGLQTMSYARIRKTDSDFERVVRQQKVIQAIYKQLGRASLSQLMEAISLFIGKVGTDITLNDAMSLLGDIMKIEEVSIQTLSIPVRGAFSSKLIQNTFFLVPNLKRNRTAIHQFLNSVPDAQPVD